MYTERINIGKAVREYRRERNITKEQLAEKLKISVSYVEKIEAGRMPGMRTYQKLMNLLDANMVIHKETETVQEKCAEKVQEILLGSTEAQAVFMTNMMEALAENIELVVM
ncbi:MAG: helix-turn-helix domain-containing protein [Blautia sp.]|nr:helix-turn-helix domain-containing protein [Blautia sp.]